VPIFTALAKKTDRYQIGQTGLSIVKATAEYAAQQRAAKATDKEAGFMADRRSASAPRLLPAVELTETRIAIDLTLSIPVGRLSILE
jgi:hypothetical protein